MALVEAVKVVPLAVLDKDEEVEFVWGRKRGIGGKRKEVQFYESFTYDGVEYALYDCVYMHKEGELPYIGKIIKIWENPDKSRKIKIHWFFRSTEILYHLKDVKVAENEVFLASGEGTGLANVNPLEAIAGKCNVICISEDNRNPQPSDEEVKMADYVFYRAFDVGNCTILDKMVDKVGGLDVKYVFNRKESEKASHVLKLDSDKKDDKTAVEYRANGESFGLKPQKYLGTAKVSHLLGKSDVDGQSSPLVRQDASQRDTNVSRVNQETAKKGNSVPGEKNSHDLGVAKAAGKSSHLVGRSDVDAQSSPIREDALHGDANDSHIEQQSTMKGNATPVLVVNSRIATTVVHNQNTLSEENALCTVKNDKKVNKLSIELVEAGERGKPSKDLGILDSRPSKRIKVNGSVKLSEDKGGDSVQKSTVCRNDKEVMGTGATPSEERKKSGDSKLSGGLDKNMQSRKDGAALDIRPPKKANIDSLKVKEDRDRSNMSIGKPVDNIGKLPKLSAGISPKEVERMGGKSFIITRRPVAESSKWFKAPPWEEVMQTSNEQGTLILLENLNPEYTSGEVEDIIWHACRENCTAKMVQRTAFSSPYSGRALVAFKTREAAERVSKMLADGCLMLSNQRPLVASFVTLPKMEGNTPSFAGHLCVDKLRLQLQREMKEAVSTSHCSQGNTIEDEMGIEWRLLQSRSDSWWNRLYKQQKEELRKTVSELKRK
ncbi:protein ANTI-SILENCING 1 [Solanum dulcamara]|uniref:protein ANTI-SILENCING 1 n=1 Tax=Solanum dulcamara TaxID=45834 RepID=UPI002486855B|nr:protein ANTI-SILENCING 1 [Solanum dulcamara]